MWIEKIHNFMETNKKTIDLNIFYHQSYYVCSILKGIVDFKINKLKNNKTSLQITKNTEDKPMIIKKEEFINWWYFDRFTEIVNEERKILIEFNNYKSEVYKQIETIVDTEIDDNDTTESKEEKKNTNLENNSKREELLKMVKEKADLSNRDIDILRKFRGMFTNLSDIDEFMKCLIYIS
tara:strand:+ start:57 stop:596 length:540 start_codon:yes stop_codon:yes gene_type:complete